MEKETIERDEFNKIVGIELPAKKEEPVGEVTEENLQA